MDNVHRPQAKDMNSYEFKSQLNIPEELVAKYNPSEIQMTAMASVDSNPDT